MEKVFLLKDLFRKGFFFQNIFLEKVFKNLLKVAELEREFTDCNYLTRLRFAFIDAFCHFYCNSHLDCRQGQTIIGTNRITNITLIRRYEIAVALDLTERQVPLSSENFFIFILYLPLYLLLHCRWRSGSKTGEWNGKEQRVDDGNKTFDFCSFYQPFSFTTFVSNEQRLQSFFSPFFPVALAKRPIGSGNSLTIPVLWRREEEKS